MNLEFGGAIWFWKGPAPWHFITVPEHEGGARSDGYRGSPVHDGSPRSGTPRNSCRECEPGLPSGPNVGLGSAAVIDGWLRPPVVDSRGDLGQRRIRVRAGGRVAGLGVPARRSPVPERPRALPDGRRSERTVALSAAANGARF